MKTLSIVIPVFNEAQRIQKAFTELEKLRLPRGIQLTEVIFVNDGSTDRTLARIKKSQILNTKYQIRIISYKQNRGKGYAVRTGMLVTTTDYALLCDADMSVPLSDLRLFTKTIKHNDDVIIGTRKTGISAKIVHQPRYRELMGRCFTKMSQTILKTDVSDFTCGFKCFSRHAIAEIFPESMVDRWGYDAEIIRLAQNAGIRVTEIPVSYIDDPRTRVALARAIPQTALELLFIAYRTRLLPALLIKMQRFVIAPVS